jgi:hypothetical protein
MPELIAYSIEEYQMKAIHIAKDEAESIRIKNKTASLIGSSKLFDAVSTTKDIEKAYQIIYQRYINNLPTEHVFIASE